MPKDSQFRNWVRNLYHDCCEERLLYKQPADDLKKYFNDYKWWLKREYQFQKDKTDVG
jgi:hypothetical protein